MPVYDYQHTDEKPPCRLGREFEWTQPMSEDALERCPECGRPVRRLISLVGVSTPKTNTELKDMGFTKLVRRDKGVYENVTASGGESRVMEAGKPETLPNLKGKISD